MARLIPVLSDEQKLQVEAAIFTLLTAGPNDQPVPFRHQGRTLKGMDCIGAVGFAFRSAGFEINDRTNYGRLPADRKLAAAMEEHFGPPVLTQARPDDLQRCDVLTFAWGGEEAHLGMAVAHPYGIGIVHSLRDWQRVIYQRIDDLIASRIVGVYRP